MTYVEQSDGKSIGGRDAEDICRYARSIWIDLYSWGMAPKKWGDAPRSVQDQYARDMENKWPVLQLCANSWKVHYLATKNYPQWYKSYHKKACEFNKPDTKGPPPKKRKVEIEDDDADHCQTDPDTDTDSAC